MRHAVYRNMTHTIETAALMDDADVEAWWAPDAEVTVRLVAAIAVASMAVPSLNARFDPERGLFEPLASIDVGIAIETAEGTVVPVLCDVGHSSATELRRRLTSMRRLMEGCACAPSITLMNFGHLLPCRYAMVPIAPPQVAIVAAGEAMLQPVRREGHVAYRHRLPLSLSFDKRACSIGEAAGFLAAMKADLARPDLPLARGSI